MTKGYSLTYVGKIHSKQERAIRSKELEETANCIPKSWRRARKSKNYNNQTIVYCIRDSNLIEITRDDSNRLFSIKFNFGSIRGLESAVEKYVQGYGKKYRPEMVKIE